MHSLRGIQVTNLLLCPKGLICTEMKFLAHEILHLGFFFQYVQLKHFKSASPSNMVHQSYVSSHNFNIMNI